MPNASLNANPQHTARIGYSGFDMSQRCFFTSSTGHLCPVYYDVLSPGDKITARAVIKTRTAPLLTATQMNITEHVEWFFVPLEQIYSAFGNFYYGIDDFDNALMKPMYGTAKTIDGLPYGNLYELLGGTLYSTGLATSIDDVGDNGAHGWYRLLDCLGLPVSNNLYLDYSVVTGSFPVSPLFFCAYQKIYSDFYRLTDREENQPASYNLDDLVYLQTRQIPATTFLNRFGKIHYRPWKKDFFKGNSVSPLFGSQSLGSQPSTYNDLINGVEQWLSGLTAVSPGSPNSNTAYSRGGTTQVDDVTPTTVRLLRSTPSSSVVQGNLTALQSTLNPANLRALFASEKLLEITRRAGKHYDKQTLAHWGVDVPDGVDGEVIYLGAQHANLHVGDVVSNAATQTTDAQGHVVDTPLGEIAGKGFVYGSGDAVRFEAKCHGILMAVYSAEPDAVYDQSGVDKLMTLIDRTDFVIPEYENLGMQPLFGYQSLFSDNPANNSTVLGWQYRYQEFKQKYDRVFGAFGQGMSLDQWVHSVQPYLVSLQSYLIPPNTLNEVMVYGYDMMDGQHSFPPSDFQTFIEQKLYNGDPLYHFFEFDVKKSSKMSVYGLPSL